jgi:hypothetical protein
LFGKAISKSNEKCVHFSRQQVAVETTPLALIDLPGERKAQTCTIAVFNSEQI